MKKKLLALLCLLLALITVAVTVVGCGEGADSDEDDEEEVVDKDKKDDKDDKKNDKDDKKNDKKNERVSIEETLLVDQDGVKLTATEYVYDDIWGEGIKFLVENSTSQNLIINSSSTVVNDYAGNQYFYCDIAAGKKATETCWLSQTSLEAAGIKMVAQIEIAFHVYDSDTYDDLFTTDYLTLKTSAYGSVEFTPNDKGTELYAGNGVRIVYKQLVEDEIWGTSVLLFVENKTGKEIYLTCDDVSVNGFMVDGTLLETIPAGKMSMCSISLDSDSMEESGITEIEEIELTFSGVECSTWDTVFETDPITIQVK